MKYSSLEGKRYISLARCSTAGQADTSIPDQLALIAAFAKEHGMTHTADFALDGVSGSVPGARRDIDQIIHRKKTLNDFEVLLVQDTTRFTRGGIAHGNKLEWELNAVGIQVVFVTDNIVDGDRRRPAQVGTVPQRKAARQKHFNGHQPRKHVVIACRSFSPLPLTAVRDRPFVRWLRRHTTAHHP
jgi:hypothetical protein